MPHSPLKQSSKAYSPLLIALGILAVGSAVWMAIVGSTNSGQSTPSQPLSSHRDGVAETLLPAAPVGQRAESASRTKTGDRSAERADRNQDPDVPLFPMVEAILGDETLTPKSAANRLLNMAADPSLPVREREEALAHGLNLDAAAFLGLTATPSLPTPMASRLLDAILNHNEFREAQITSCLALMGHEEPTIREQATKQLAFYIGLEEWSHDPDTLRKEAAEFLRDLAKSPPLSPPPDESGVDSPAPEAAESAGGEGAPASP